MAPMSCSATTTAPANKDAEAGRRHAAWSARCLMLLEQGATHIGVATDHVIESFRNDLWPTYKTGAGVDPTLLAQFPVVEEALAAAGFTVWPMVEVEADDALGRRRRRRGRRRPGRAGRSSARRTRTWASACGGKVVQWDRRQDKWFDAERRARAKLGVPPAVDPRSAWRSWATAPTASPACPAGAPSRPPP